VKIVVQLWNFQLLQLDGGRVEGEADGKGKLGVHEKGGLQGWEKQLVL
jgi:hypothetical protein